MYPDEDVKARIFSGSTGPNDDTHLFPDTHTRSLTMREATFFPCQKDLEDNIPLRSHYVSRI